MQTHAGIFLGSWESEGPRYSSLVATSGAGPSWRPWSSAAYLKAVYAHIFGNVNNRTLRLANGRAILVIFSAFPIR